MCYLMTAKQVAKAALLGATIRVNNCGGALLKASTLVPQPGCDQKSQRNALVRKRRRTIPTAFGPVFALDTRFWDDFLGGGVRKCPPPLTLVLHMASHSIP